MTKSIIEFDQDARNSLLKGIMTALKAVKPTMGPRGSRAIIGRETGIPLITQDGAEILNALHLADSRENLGIQEMRDVTQQAESASGDGTSAGLL